ncbi:MAG: protein kinase, partial [Pseudomonadota bacterium]
MAASPDSSSNQTPILLPDSMVDHFRVVRLVGRGGMGEVYLARDTLLNRRVALKVIRPRYLDSEEAEARFMREAQLTASLSHPHIVTVYAVGKHEGRPYLALEYLEGQNLRERMAEERPGARESLRTMLAIAQALAEAHRHRVLHRDLKPDNVILARDGRARLVDLGLARMVSAATSVVALEPAPPFGTAPGPGPGPGLANAPAEAEPSTSVSDYVTAAGTVQGTPSYMAPEQWRGEECSEATDIWAFGVILHELLVGRRPYQGLRKELVGSVVVKLEPVPALVPTQDTPAELVGLVARCLEKDAARRPAAAQVVETLDHLVAGHRRQDLAEQSPFRGLFPFSELHSDLFFGRDTEIAVFLESLREQAVLPVAGPSGAGKSSFVQAGVLPRLREQGVWTALTIRPGVDPFGALAARLATGQSIRRLSEGTDSVVHLSDIQPPEHLRGVPGAEEAVWTSLLGSDDAGALASQLRQSPAALGVLLHDLAARERGKVLLFVDQLEELFTMGADRMVQEAFLRAICGVADHPSSPVRAVFTIRDDFLGRLGGGPEVAAALTRVFVLRRPGREALEEVLTRPLAAVGYFYDDPALPAEMVESVSDEPACLPLLQFAGQMLWERRDKNRRLLCRTAYATMGGVAGSLAEHADGVLAGMTPAQVELARQLLLRLVTAAGTRRVVPVAAAIAGLGAGVKEVLDRLTLARLLTVRRGRGDSSGSGGGGGSGGGSGGGEAVLELVHESLVRTWKRLARWIEESHEELALLAEVGQAAELWEKRGRRDEEVWQGDALAEVRRKLARWGTRIPGQVAEFLKAGLRKEKRRRQRKLALVAGVMALLAVATVWSLLRERETRVQKVRAEEGWSRARQGEAEAQREGASAALGRGELVEARARLRSSLETQDSLLGRALWWKLDRDPLEWTVTLGSVPYDVAYAPDGRSVAAACHDGLVNIIDVVTTGIRPLRGEDVTAVAVAYSPDGRYLASGQRDGRVRIWDLASGASRVLTGHKDVVNRLAFSPDGRH